MSQTGEAEQGSEGFQDPLVEQLPEQHGASSELQQAYDAGLLCIAVCPASNVSKVLWLSY